MATTEAIRYYGPGDIRVEQIPIPVCAADEVRVRVDACAICGTDLKAYRHGNPRIQAPQVMGHEFTGLIDRIGDSVEGFAEGERVVMATSVSCGSCRYCQRGWPNLCLDVAPMGFSYPGGMAGWVVIPSRAIRQGHLVKVPAGIEARVAALAEPLSCAINAIEQCQIHPGERVLVIGAGPMGILNGCAARAAGAGEIWMTEINEARLQQAAAFGFDRLINPGEADLTEVVHEATGGIGVDTVIVAAPAAAPQEQAPHLVRKRGTVCLFASLPADRRLINLDSRVIHYGELRVVGASDSAPSHVQQAVAMLGEESFPARQIARHQAGLGQLHEAFEWMECGEALRVVLIPDPSEFDDAQGTT